MATNSSCFGRIGAFCVTNKAVPIWFCFTLTMILGLGLLNIKLETDP
jgi:hypothetical protein